LEREVEATEVDNAHHSRGHEHVYVLSEEVQAHFHRAVLGVVATHQLGFALRQVERRTVGFGESADDEDDKAQRLLHHVPEVPLARHRLLQGDVTQRKRARHHEHGNQGQAHS